MGMPPRGPAKPADSDAGGAAGARATSLPPPWGVGTPRAEVPPRPQSRAYPPSEGSFDDAPMFGLVADTVIESDEVSFMAPQKPSSMTLLEQGISDVSDCVSWLRPKRKDEGFLSTLARLSVETTTLNQEWHADERYLDDGEAPPLDPHHTAQATSMLLRLLQSLPPRLPLRGMLELIARVLLRAIYREFPWLEAFGEYEEADLSPERFEQLIPFFAIYLAAQGTTEKAEARATAAVKEAEMLRRSSAQAKEELATAQQRCSELEEQLSKTSKALQVAEANITESQEAYKKLRNDMRTGLADFNDLQNKVHEKKLDLLEMQRDNKTKDAAINEFMAQNRKLRTESAALERENATMQARLARQRTEIEQVPRLKEHLAQYERAEAIHGISFAVRVAREVLGIEMEEIKAAASEPSGHVETKSIIENVCMRLRALPQQIATLKSRVEHLHRQVRDYRQLIPTWNVDTVEDLEDAYNQDAAVHRQIYSMRDRRGFAGLGRGEHVPPYLRAEGIVRHVFVSKAELERFIEQFNQDLSCVPGKHVTTELMHQELQQHMLRRAETHSESLTEFAYAFICGLEAYRHDPDFELFDLMLSGAVHPSVTKDQADMLNGLEHLLRSCPEGPLGDEGGGGAAAGGMSPSRWQGGAAPATRELVSRRIIRSALEVIFPEKSAAHQDALRQALHLTVQMLGEAAKTPNLDSVYVHDLFAATADGSQTPFIEEVRRQHVYEIVTFTAELSRRLLDLRPLEPETTTDDKTLVEVFTALDPRAEPVHVKQLVRTAFPEPGTPVPVSDVLRRLRHGMLLRPERLWVRAEPRDVVKHILMLSNRALMGQDGEEGQPSNPKPSRRNRALKVVDNPLQAIQANYYSHPDHLEKAVTQTSRQDAFHITADSHQDGAG